MGVSITGLSSKLDTAQIISDLMDVERVPYTNLTTKKTNLQSEQAVFRQINTKLNALQVIASDLQYNSAYQKNTATFTNSGIATAKVEANASKESYELNVTELAKKQITALAGIKDTDKNLINGTFEINGETIKIADLGTFDNDKDALKALVSEINSNTDKYGGKASMIDADGNGAYTLSVTANKTGLENAKVDFKLNGQSSTEQQAAKDAKLTIDGVAVSRPSNEITGLLNGVTLNLQSTGSSTFTVGVDTDAIVKQVESFVTAYNDLVKVIKTNLAKPADEDTINPLQGDSLLKTIQNDLYNMFTSVVDNNSRLGFMEALGLSIDKGVTKGSLMTGEITLDKDALKSALNTDAGKVSEVFTNIMTNMSTTLRSTYTSSVKGVMAMKISGYDSEIKMVDERLEQMDRSLTMKEARLKQQFSTMEVMLSSLQTQQDWLTSQFEALTNSK